MQGTIDAAVPTLAAATGIMSFKFFWLRHDFFLYSADEKKKKTMNTTVVLKFGGTSVMAPEAIQRIVLTAAESHQVVLVVSALAGITNALTLGKNNVVKRLQEDWQAHHGTSVNVDDLPMEPASGEKASARLIAAYLEQHGIAATAIFADADKVVHSARGRISFVDPTAIESCLSRNVVPVVTGFVSRDEVSGQTACLDRGGSDVSAVAIAARLHCEATIFTDVDGIKDCDPRLVPHAQTIPLLSVAEAKEMAFAGASILHPYTLSFATKSIEVRSTFDGWDGACTTISPLRINVPSARDVQALAVLQDCCIVDITGYETGKSGVAAKVFAALEHINIHMIMQTCTETMISLVIEEKDVRVLDQLTDYTVATRKGAIVTVIGQKLQHQVGVAARIFQTVASTGVNVECISQGSSELSLSFVVRPTDLKPVVTALYATFLGDAHL